MNVEETRSEKFWKYQLDAGLQAAKLDDPCELLIACEEAGVTVNDVVTGQVELNVVDESPQTHPDQDK